MIGYLSLNEIDDEIALATAEHAKPSNDSSEDIDAEEIQEDIDAYVETLQKAKDLGLGIVSFRH
jgi:2,4-dienoyl-CoA reductase-like NADH-dependent reductase (Old Yellow Enzyme family)